MNRIFGVALTAQENLYLLSNDAEPSKFLQSLPRVQIALLRFAMAIPITKRRTEKFYGYSLFG